MCGSCALLVWSDLEILFHVNVTSFLLSKVEEGGCDVDNIFKTLCFFSSSKKVTSSYPSTCCGITFLMAVLALALLWLLAGATLKPLCLPLDVLDRQARVVEAVATTTTTAITGAVAATTTTTTRSSSPTTAAGARGGVPAGG